MSDSNESSHSLPRVPAPIATERDVMITSDPRVDYGAREMNDPRVNNGPLPTDDPRVDDEPDMTCDPRVRWAEPLSTATDEPLSCPLTTNVPVDYTSNDLSYTQYLHNGPQRRRRIKRNRRHHNPLPPQPSTAQPVPNHRQPPAPNPPVPALDTNTSTTTSQLPDREEPTVRFNDKVTYIPPTRQSSRGKKIVRFDPKTHRVIPHTMNSLVTRPNNH